MARQKGKQPTELKVTVTYTPAADAAERLRRCFAILLAPKPLADAQTGDPTPSGHPGGISDDDK